MAHISHTQQQSGGEKKKRFTERKYTTNSRVHGFSPLHHPTSDKNTDHSQSPHIHYLREEVQQLTSGLRAARKRGRRKEYLGILPFHSSLPSWPVLVESDCPRMQNSWLGAKK